MTEPRLPTLGRLSGAARFAAVLGLKPCAKSPHFAAFHHAEAELSTAPAATPAVPVDGAPPSAPGQPAAGAARRLGLVVPKRFARRAVTRNLVKRQMRAAMRLQAGTLAAGDWVLRLRAPLAVAGEAAAATTALRRRVHGELAELLAAAARRCPARERAAAGA